MFALKILCGGPGKGRNPNEEYSAGFLCAVTTQEPQILSQEVLKSHELTAVIPLGGQMLLPGCGWNNEDEEHPERCSQSFQASAAEAGGWVQVLSLLRVLSSPKPFHPSCKTWNHRARWKQSFKRDQVEFIHPFPRRGNSAATTKNSWPLGPRQRCFYLHDIQVLSILRVKK